MMFRRVNGVVIPAGDRGLLLIILNRVDFSNDNRTDAMYDLYSVGYCRLYCWPKSAGSSSLYLSHNQMVRHPVNKHSSPTLATLRAWLVTSVTNYYSLQVARISLRCGYNRHMI